MIADHMLSIDRTGIAQKMYKLRIRSIFLNFFRMRSVHIAPVVCWEPRAYGKLGTTVNVFGSRYDALRIYGGFCQSSSRVLSKECRAPCDAGSLPLGGLLLPHNHLFLLLTMLETFSSPSFCRVRWKQASSTTRAMSKSSRGFLEIRWLLP